MSEDQREPWDTDDEPQPVKPKVNIDPPLDFANAGTFRDDPDTPRDIGALAKQWVWIIGMKRWVRRRDGATWDKDQFDSKFNPLTRQSSVSRALWSDANLLHRFERRVYRPGAPEFGAGGTWYNVWKPGPIVPKEGDTSLWDQHLLWLVPDDDDRNILLDWMAWTYQNPLKRPGKALLIVGEVKGSGKSFICRVMEHLIGQTNTQRPQNSSLVGQFNGWAGQCKLVIFEELNQIGKRDAINKLHELITEPMVEVNIKYVPAFLTENYMAGMANSNHPDALPIDEGDRRWEVIKTPVTQAEKDARVAEGFYKQLMRIVDEPDTGALAAIAYQLSTRDVSKFVQGDAQMTEAKSDMIKLGAKELDKWLAENRSNHPFTRGLVNIDDDIIKVIPDHVMRDHNTRSISAMVAKFLKRKCDGVSIGSHRNGKGRLAKQVNLWAINDLGVEAKARIKRTGCDPRQALGKLNVTATYRAECKDATTDDADARFEEAYRDFSADPAE